MKPEEILIDRERIVNLVAIAPTTIHESIVCKYAARWSAALDEVESQKETMRNLYKGYLIRIDEEKKKNDTLTADNAKLTDAVKDMSHHIERLKDEIERLSPSRGHQVEEFYK